VFPAASFLGEVPSTQHKIQRRPQQDLLYRLTGPEPSCRGGRSVDADVCTGATRGAFTKDCAGMPSDLGWETAGQTGLAEAWARGAQHRAGTPAVPWSKKSGIFMHVPKLHVWEKEFPYSLLQNKKKKNILLAGRKLCA